MKTFLVLLAAVIINAAQIGVLKYKKGIVKVKHQGSILKRSLNAGDAVNSGDTVYTYDSLAKIVLNDGSVIKLDRQSEIKFDKKIVQNEGKIYYHIKHRKVGTLEVMTNFTTIGVKGTVFVVDNSNKTIGLKKGVISLNAKEGVYKIHKLKKEFDNYKKSVTDEFNSYKKKMQKEFIEYKKSFDIKSNTMVIFSGKNEVYEKKLDNSMFKVFESF